MDSPALCEGRRVHPIRRGHRDVPETRDREAHYSLGGQRAARIRDSSQQILLPLPAADTLEGTARRVLEVGSRSGEDAGGVCEMSHRRSSEPWLDAVPADWPMSR